MNNRGEGCVWLTEISGIIGKRASETNLLQVGNNIGTTALVDTLPFSQHIHLVKHAEQFCWRGVNWANYCPTTTSYSPQKSHTLRTGKIVQTPKKRTKSILKLIRWLIVCVWLNLRSGFIKEHQGGIIDQFQSHTESLSFATRQFQSLCVCCLL